MSIITIISHPPKPGGRSVPDSYDFDTVESAIEYLQSLPPADQLPAGDGTTDV